MNESNSCLYLPEQVSFRYPKVYEDIKQTVQCDLKLLNNTKDVWARDYMPYQLGEDQFIAFRYEPSYLKAQKYRNTITDSTLSFPFKKENLQYSNLNVDGGNIISHNRTTIMCDRAISENPELSKSTICSTLIQELQLEKLILIPTHKNDLFGHADGLVRWIDDKTVAINDSKDEDCNYYEQLTKALKKHSLNIEVLPYNPYQNRTLLDATGTYTNFLELDTQILCPVYRLPEDEVVLKLLESWFPSKTIHPVQSTELAKAGGILNCISWPVVNHVNPIT